MEEINSKANIWRAIRGNSGLTDLGKQWKPKNVGKGSHRITKISFQHIPLEAILLYRVQLE